MTDHLTDEHLTDETFTVSYVHAAPPALVFACMTTPEHLCHFWGPTGTHTPLERIVIDLRPGGPFETTIVSDDSGDMFTMRASYLEIDAPRLLRWRELGSDLVTELQFHDRGDGTTEVVTTQRGLPPHLRTPQARAGWGTALDRFARYINALTMKDDS